MADANPNPNQALIDALIAALAANQTAQATAIANAIKTSNATKTTYAATPGMHEASELLDYGTKSGKQAFLDGCAALDTKFDMTAASTVDFVHEIERRARISGWDVGTYDITNFNIAPNTTGTTPIMKNLFLEYGQIPVSVLTTVCEDWQTGDKKESRATQNNEQMGLCIIKSLTDEAKCRLTAHYHEFTFNKVIYAPLLFKVVMRLATVDSRATTAVLRENLHNLNHQMVLLNNDIPEFNRYFTNNYEQLIGRGESIDDPIHLLFKGYKAVSDIEFQRYVRAKEDDYMDHMPYLDGLTHVQLIQMMTDRYNKKKVEGTWMVQSAEEKKIIALTAELKEVKDALALSRPLLEKLKAGGTQNQGGEKKEKKKNKKPKGNKEQQKKDEQWKKKAPKDGEPKTKKHNKQTYHWCIHHMAWTVHTPEECRQNPSNPSYKPPRPHTAQASLAQAEVPSAAVAHSAQVNAFLVQLALLSEEL